MVNIYTAGCERRVRGSIGDERPGQLPSTREAMSLSTVGLKRENVGSFNGARREIARSVFGSH